MKLPLSLCHDYWSLLWCLWSCRMPLCLLGVWCGKAWSVHLLLQGDLAILWTWDHAEDTGLMDLLVMPVCLHAELTKANGSGHHPELFTHYGLHWMKLPCPSACLLWLLTDLRFLPGSLVSPDQWLDVLSFTEILGCRCQRESLWRRSCPSCEIFSVWMSRKMFPALL